MTKHITIFKGLILATLVFINIKGHAQGYDPSKIIPPSPTAGALGAYGSYPIGYNTGTPNISIPLYSIKSHDNALDILLSYNASGIKVAQDASWVGLGWSLMAGGVITKTTRGYDDFKDAGAYYNSGPIPIPTGDGLPLPGDRPAFDEALNGRSDMEPDLYSYNFGGYSGRFVLGKKSDGSKIYIDERNNLKIEYKGTWTITDPKGFQYNFTIAESANNYAYNSTVAEVPETTTLAPFAFESISTTGWYLTSIVSPHGDVITFNYVRGSSLSLINRSQTQYDINMDLASCLFAPPFNQANEKFLPYYKSFNASRQLNNELYLQSIVFSDGSVEFSTTDRKDIDYYDVNQKPAKLNTVVILDNAHQLLKTYTFSYSYFNDAPGGSSTNTNLLRLRLDAVTESGSDGVSIPPYKFTYYNIDNLPSKDSKSIDHWGYYNAASNSTLIPLPSSLSKSLNPNIIGANREPDIDHMYFKNAVLSSIAYPTGGHTDFDYELNDYAHLQKADAFKDASLFFTVNAADWDHFDHTTVSFDITDLQLDPLLILDPKDRKTTATINSQYTYVSGTMLFNGVGGNYGNFTGPGTGASFDVPPSTDGKGGQSSVVRSLTPGHYVLNVRYNQGYTESANVAFNIKVPVTQKQGGGLRIQSIVNYDNNGNAHTRKFLYTNPDGSSSGRLLTQPIYGFQCPQIQIVGLAGCNPTSMYTYRASGSVYPAGLSSAGNTIGYDKVTELIGPNGEDGKTEYYYLNEEDWMLGQSPAPGLPTLSYPLNGRLAKQIDYNAAGQILKEVDNAYSLQNTQSIPGDVIYNGPPIPTSFTFDPSGDFTGFTVNNGNPYNVYSYDNKSNWTTLDNTKETDYYYQNGQTSSLVTNRNFYYDNPAHLQLTRQMETRSDGKVLTTFSSYPDDYAAGTIFLDDMKTAHQTGVPIEQVSYLTDNNNTTTITKGAVTQYLAGGKGLIDKVYQFESTVPKLLSAFKFSNAAIGQLPPGGTGQSYSFDSSYQLKMTINQYDNLGNPLMLTPADGNPVTYIWSYNQQYPIAKIQNADFTTVSGILGGTTSVNNFAGSFPTDASASSFLALLRSNNTSLKNSLITTYTFKSGFGMTSSVDAKNLTTTYEYDNFQRLINVKDKDGNIVKHTDYHYQGQ